MQIGVSLKKNWTTRLNKFILLRFSRGFTQSQFNSTINKFITLQNTPYNN